MSTTSVLVKDKKCGTCEYWAGERVISRMIDNKPHSISVVSGSYSCAVQAKKTIQGTGTCMKWKKWCSL
jgi:hypothetical protein